MTIEERFWSKVKIGGPSECWIWQAGLTANNYGGFWFEGKTLGAHRVALALSGHWLAPDEQARHVVCDNPPCCNPSHLIPGTPRQNTDDMLDKDRQAKGQRVYGSIVNEKDVLIIFEDRANGASLSQIADKFKITSAQVSHILKRQAWSHVKLPSELESRVHSVNCSIKISSDKKQLLFKLRQQGLTQKEIGVRLGVTQAAISYVLCRTPT